MVVVAICVAWRLDRDRLLEEVYSRHIRDGMGVWVLHAETNIQKTLKMLPGDRATIEVDEDGSVILNRDDSSVSVHWKRPK
jgi:hypothetical protein